MAELQNNNMKDTIIRIWHKITFAFNKNSNSILKLALSEGDVRVFRYIVKQNKLQELAGNYFKDSEITLDYIGKLIHKKDKARYNFILERFIKGFMTKTTAHYLMLDVKSDKYRYTEFVYDIFKEKESKPKAVVFAVKDNDNEITYKHKLDSNNRWLEMITQATDISVWNFSTADSKFNYADIGFSMDDRPIYISDLINKTHPQDKPTVKTLAELFKKRRNQAFNIDIRIDVSSGNNIWNDVILYGLPTEIDENGDVNIYSGYMMDVTEKIKDKKILKEAMAKAQKSEELKEQFVANISHYIRTPLNSIMGFGQIIGQCTSDEERQLCLDTMNQNNDDLLKCINDLLEYSSLSAGYFQLKKEAFNICDLLETAKAILDARVKEGILTESDCPVDHFVIEWDKEKMRNILNYLIDNAIKVTTTGTISLGVYGTTEGVEVSCKYNGADLSSKTEDAMYDSFSKPDFEDSLHSLELRLCQLLCEKTEGQMNIDTDFEHNTEITLHIPCSILDFGNKTKE